MCPLAELALCFDEEKDSMRPVLNYFIKQWARCCIHLHGAWYSSGYWLYSLVNVWAVPLLKISKNYQWIHTCKVIICEFLRGYVETAVGNSFCLLMMNKMTDATVFWRFAKSSSVALVILLKWHLHTLKKSDKIFGPGLDGVVASFKLHQSLVFTECAIP